MKADLKARNRKWFNFPFLTFTPLPLAASNNKGTTGSLGGPEAKTVKFAEVQIDFDLPPFSSERPGGYQDKATTPAPALTIISICAANMARSL